MLSGAEQEEKLDGTIDRLLEDMGSIGKLHFIIFVGWVLSDNAVFILLMALSFLTKVPSEYFCRGSGGLGEPESCKPEDFCKDASVSFEPNMALDDSY